MPKSKSTTDKRRTSGANHTEAPASSPAAAAASPAAATAASSSGSMFSSDEQVLNEFDKACRIREKSQKEGRSRSKPFEAFPDNLLVKVQELAESSNPRAQYLLGNYYEKIKESPVCVNWMRMAADNQYPQAMYRMGIYYTEGKFDVKQDFDEAASWLHQARNSNQEGRSQVYEYLADRTDTQIAAAKKEVNERIKVMYLTGNTAQPASRPMVSKNREESFADKLEAAAREFEATRVSKPSNFSITIFQPKLGEMKGMEEVGKDIESKPTEIEYSIASASLYTKKLMQHTSEITKEDIPDIRAAIIDVNVDISEIFLDKNIIQKIKKYIHSDELQSLLDLRAINLITEIVNRSDSQDNKKDTFKRAGTDNFESINTLAQKVLLEQALLTNDLGGPENSGLERWFNVVRTLQEKALHVAKKDLNDLAFDVFNAREHTVYQMIFAIETTKPQPRAAAATSLFSSAPAPINPVLDEYMRLYEERVVREGPKPR